MTAAATTGLFDCTRLVAVFDRCFAVSENTCLIGGADEPFYLPAEREGAPHRLYFREDFFASALHEVAHWCIAGPARRRLPDFGYWYAPEGRSSEQQRAFEAVEVKPQALEWLFSAACNYRFRVSVDNFGAAGELVDTSSFRHAVAAQARHWQQFGLPPRAAIFFQSLNREFAAEVRLQDLDFDPEAVA